MRMQRTCKAVLSVLLMAAATGWAAVSSMGFQGVYRENGIPYNGMKQMTFRVTDSAGASEYWTSGPQDVAVSSGIFRGTFSVPATHYLSGLPIYLEVSVAGAVLLPRKRIVSVPYAFHANAASTLVPASGQGAVVVASSITISAGSFSAGSLAIGTDSAAGPLHVRVGGRDALFVSPDAKIGIGTTNPTERLEIADGNVTTGGTVFFPDGTYLSSAKRAGLADVLVSTGDVVMSATMEGITSGNSFSLTVGESLALLIGQTGNVGIGTFDQPTNAMDVNGGAVVHSSLTVRGSGLSGTQTALSVAGSTFVVRADGRVGIGTSNPECALEVSGHIQLPVFNSAPNVPPPAADCSAAAHAGRMTLSTGGDVWVCANPGGWWRW